MQKWILVGSVAIGFSLLTPIAASADEILELREFLRQVKAKNLSLQAAASREKHATDATRDAELALSPQLFSTAIQSVDKKETANTAFQGTQTDMRSYTVGVSKQTSYGLNAKLSYNATSVDLSGTNPAFTEGGKQWESHPNIELSQSLWRNAFGSETRDMLALADSQADMNKHAADFQQRALLADAEMRYWRLALARELVNLQTENFARAQKIYDWNRKRVGMQLADRTDQLQAEAALKFRELELAQAKNEERAAATQFNQARGVSDDNVAEKIVTVDGAHLESMDSPVHKGERSDVTAAKAQAQISQAQADLTAEKYRPTLELFGSYALNGRDPEYKEAQGESFKTEYPTTAIGLRFNAILDRSTVGRQVGAARAHAQAAKFDADYKSFETEELRSDLQRRFDETQERLKLARKIEQVQSDKLKWERERQQRGRSTTFQVLQFEQDIANAQLARIQTESELLRIHAQLQTFGEYKL